MVLVGLSKAQLFRLLGKSPRVFVEGSLYSAGGVLSYLQQGVGLTPRCVRMPCWYAPWAA